MLNLLQLNQANLHGNHPTGDTPHGPHQSQKLANMLAPAFLGIESPPSSSELSQNLTSPRPTGSSSRCSVLPPGLSSLPPADSCYQHLISPFLILGTLPKRSVPSSLWLRSITLLPSQGLIV